VIIKSNTVLNTSSAFCDGLSLDFFGKTRHTTDIMVITTIFTYNNMEGEMEVESVLVEEGEEVDEYQLKFEDLEEMELNTAKIPQYIELLSSPRVDDKAVKIKEQCIYRY
jgi:hypothetical protein